MTLQASVLSEVQLKQERERKVAAEVIHEATSPGNATTWLSSLKKEVGKVHKNCCCFYFVEQILQEYDIEMSKLRAEHEKWEQAVTSPSSASQQTLSEDDVGRLAEERESHRSLLVRAVALRVASACHDTEPSPPSVHVHVLSLHSSFVCS